jgi:hypothetical protein
MERREIVGGSLLASLAAMVAPDGAEGMEQRSSDSEIARAIDELRATIERQGSSCALGACTTISTIRTQQRTFIKANRKYPDFIDVGPDAWEAVYDWHVKHRQQLNATRMPDGRYGILFMFTTVVLREDQVPSFVGWGYDAR